MWVSLCCCPVKKLKDVSYYDLGLVLLIFLFYKKIFAKFLRTTGVSYTWCTPVLLDLNNFLISPLKKKQIYGISNLQYIFEFIADIKCKNYCIFIGYTFIFELVCFKNALPLYFISKLVRQI